MSGEQLVVVGEASWGTSRQGTGTMRAVVEEAAMVELGVMVDKHCGR